MVSGEGFQPHGGFIIQSMVNERVEVREIGGGWVLSLQSENITKGGVVKKDGRDMGNIGEPEAMRMAADRRTWVGVI